MAKDMETRQRFVELRAAGWSFDRITVELQVSKPTLIKWSRDLEVEIAALEAIHLEALFEKHFVQKAGRIRLLGEQLAAVRKELARRDLSKVSTSALLGLLVRLAESLKSEEVELEFFTPGEETEEREKVRFLREHGLTSL